MQKLSTIARVSLAEQIVKALADAGFTDTKIASVDEKPELIRVRASHLSGENRATIRLVGHSFRCPSYTSDGIDHDGMVIDLGRKR